MPQVSKYPVAKDVYERIFEVFLKTISGLKTKGQVADFLGEFLSPTEQVMLAKRLAIAFLLAKKYDYREISRILRVSTGTVGRVPMNCEGDSNFAKVVNKILQDEKIEEFWLTVGEKIASIGAAGKSKSGGWIYVREEIRKKKMKKRAL